MADVMLATDENELMEGALRAILDSPDQAVQIAAASIHLLEVNRLIRTNRILGQLDVPDA